MQRFTKQVVLVTGGTSGIGFASAKAFIDEGAMVIITGQNKERLDAAVAQLGNNACGIQADMRNIASIAEMAETIQAQFGELDVVFLNAGMVLAAAIGDVNEAHFDEQMNVNFKGSFFTIQHLLPILKDGGSIIINTSILEQVGLAGFAIYSASKAALRSLARSLTLELAERKIRVNMVSPGPIATPLYNKMGMPAGELQDMAGALVDHIPLKRFGQPEEIANAVLFLASQAATFINGEELVIDGGWMGK